MSLNNAIKERETNDSHNTFYQNVIHYYGGKEIAFIKNNKCGRLSLVFVVKPRGPLTGIFFCRTTEDRQGPECLTIFITR